MVAGCRRGADGAALLRTAQRLRAAAIGPPSGTAAHSWVPIARKRIEREEAVLARWTRIIRMVWRIRRLQRIFGYLGNFLKESFGQGIRARLRLVYP